MKKKFFAELNLILGNNRNFTSNRQPSAFPITVIPSIISGLHWIKGFKGKTAKFLPRLHSANQQLSKQIQALSSLPPLPLIFNKLETLA